jgi:mono/diheme cytochrome c family protein
VYDVLRIEYIFGERARGNHFLLTRCAHHQEELSMKTRSTVLQSLMLIVTLSFACANALTQSPPGSAGWYTIAQAADGAKTYQKTCASCHGAKLQGGMGPTLVGKQFWLTYGGKKVSTLWSEVHTEMPMTAPGSVSAKNSTNIMAFLLQKNGVPAGTMPLDDTADLSKVLPSR